MERSGAGKGTGHGEHMSHEAKGTHDMKSTHGGQGRGDHHKHMMMDFKRRFYVSLILTIPILALSTSFQSFFGVEYSFTRSSYIIFVLASTVYFYGGWPFLKGFVSELRERSPGMMTLIAVAITVAYAYSVAVTFGLTGMDFFWELATLIDIMLLGHWIEMRSVLGASRALEELSKLMPTEAHLLSDWDTVDVNVDQLKVGDRVLVRPGEKVPIDGAVIDGTSSVNEAMLTGESVPVSKEKGDEVISGSLNGEGSLLIEVGKTGKDT